jgi:hypothetical protein
MLVKLIGSKTEKEFRELLIKSNYSLFNDIKEKGFLDFLKNHFPEMTSAYIVDWIPEQGEDIYKILINDDLIVEIEKVRETNETSILNSMSVNDYKKRLSKINQIKLAVAIDLYQSSI